MATHVAVAVTAVQSGASLSLLVRVTIPMVPEWHSPVACYSYDDFEATRLLGSYIYTNVRLNVGLQATDFDRKTYGL